MFPENRNPGRNLLHGFFLKLLFFFPLLGTACKVDPLYFDPQKAVVLEPFEALSLVNTDNTGVILSENPDEKHSGNFSLKLTSSGKDQEMKVGIPLNAEQTRILKKSDFLSFYIFLPAESAETPNRAFLGLGRTDGGFQYIDGTMSTDPLEGTSGGKGRWIVLTFPLNSLMKSIDLSGQFSLYLAFFKETASGEKIPLPAGSSFFIDELIAGDY